MGERTEASAVRRASQRGYRHDVQALRGLAVLVVVLYHAGLPFPGGFVGVDLFFVISGFVIGRLIVAELAASQRLSFGSFYERRARRLLPALAVMLVAVVVTAPLLAPVGVVGSTGWTAMATSLFSANLYLYRTAVGGYFAPAVELNPLLHTWSLSVEEQFYFLIPAILAAAWRVGGRFGRSLRSLKVLIGALFAISLALNLLFSSGFGIGPLSGVEFAFFSPFTRAWEFAVGLAIVLVPDRWVTRSVVRRGAVVIGLGLIGLAVFGFSDATTFPGVAALIPVAGAAMVIFGGTRPVAETEQPAHPALRPFTWMGDISYSWYLWHWPLIVYAGAFWPRAGWPPLALAALVSLVPALLSFHLLEHRYRLRSERTVGRLPVIAAACVLLPILVVGVTRPVASVVAKRPALVELERERAQHIGRGGCHSPVPLDQRDLDECTWGDPDATRTVALIGDSNAAHFNETMIGAAAANDARLRIATMSDCQIADLAGEDAFGLQAAACERFVEGTIRQLESDPPDVVVIAGASNHLGTEARDLEAYALGLARAADRLTAAGSRVVIINEVPKPAGWDPRGCSSLLILTDASRCWPEVRPLGVDRKYRLAREAEDRAVATAGIVSWDFSDEICPDSTCRPRLGPDAVWRDDQHISVAMSQRLVPVATALLAAELDP